ncbi:IS200/IS605 family element transposase accessory protein TnpB [Scytonema hofmannii FACHB-248]|uniref:IS200/IS605 family element transposase accessory protein TnpB n=1 Tax=Scytonema hofmannii FACHB-248 TaxID=1842502 RepID=A0ABR8GZX2_9CYAN|nr:MULTISPECIES: RNA-guided endonuclease TnpB family protein [Nostocales]MBD2608556.1 IS200/IS605 family element transposase accessory protein TnpB [Scytonema hofmannii FACHB-248]
MSQVITAKLKLNLTTEQKALVSQTTLAYRDALNYTSQVAFDAGKTSNGAKLQKAVYNELRVLFGLGAQMACNVPRQVSATYKTLWTKVKQSADAIAKGYTKKRYKGLDKAPKYVSRTCTLNYQRDYSFKSEQRVSINTLNGRVIVFYDGYSKHLDLIANCDKIGAAKIVYQRSSKTYYLMVGLEIDVPDVDPTKITRISGVDVGMRYLAVETDLKNKSKFYSGKEARHKANRYHKARQTLQRKDTRSAKRRLVALAGRERRFIADVNHQISKQIAKSNSLIGLENLTGIRDRTKSKSGKKASNKQRRANRNKAKWSFAELHGYIDYKANLNGSLATKVPAHYTSQSCPKCGHTSKTNRLNKGLLFRCECCSHELHADLVGSRNIALRTLLVRQDWMSTGALSMYPNVSSVEAKGEILQRFSELRWSSDTSPHALRYSAQWWVIDY